MKSEQRTIDGIGYTCTQMDGMRAAMVSARLAKQHGLHVVQLMAGATTWAEDTTAQEILLSVGEILPSLDEDILRLTLRDLFEDRLKCDRIADQQGVEGDVWKHFDMHFAGRMVHLFAVIRFAMEVNFHDFFAVLPFQSGGGTSPQEVTGGSSP